MLKKLAAISAVALLIPVAAMADGIAWFAGENWLCYASGYPNVLPGHLSDPTVGCFVQLLWVGPNGVIDYAWDDGGDGTWTTDDLVIGKIWVGYAVGEDGYFSSVYEQEGINPEVIEGRVYFGRVWNAPSPDFAAGKIPSGPGVQYVNSPTWQYPSYWPTFDDFDLTGQSDLNTTLYPLAIPEPGVLALIVLGLVGLRFTRKSR